MLAGRLWAASYGAIYCRQRAGEDFPRFDAAEGLPAHWVRCLLFTSDGRLWAGTDSHGLFVLKGGRFAPYSLPSHLPCWRVTALAQGADGGLWVGSAAGLVRIGPHGEPTRGYTEAEGLPDNHVSALVTDAEGQLWAGTHRGLARLDHDRFVAVPLGTRVPARRSIAGRPSRLALGRLRQRRPGATRAGHAAKRSQSLSRRGLPTETSNGSSKIAKATCGWARMTGCAAFRTRSLRWSVRKTACPTAPSTPFAAAATAGFGSARRAGWPCGARAGWNPLP